MKSAPSIPKSAILLVCIALAACTATPYSTRPALDDAETQPTVHVEQESSDPLSPAPGPAGTPAGTPAGAPGSGADEDDLLDALLDNGALTESQYASLKATGLETTTGDDAATVSLGPDGFRVKSADGESSIKIGGRVQVDANFHSEDEVAGQEITDGTELRRARLELKGTLPSDVLWAAEVDFGNNVTRIKDFWVGRKTEAGPGVFFGNQKQPFSLDVEMSSNDLPFVERGVDAFLLAPFVDRAIGLRVQDHTDSVFYAVGVFGESVSPVPADISLADEGWGFTGRFVVAPVKQDNRVLHLGLRGSYREPQTAVGLLIRDETTNMSNLRVVSTGLIDEVNSVVLYGPEFVFASGPFSVGGEYTTSRVNRDGEDFEFDGWHAQATYSLTGESRAKAYRIDSGEFKRLKADSGKAWEIAARLASLDLNSGSISGGEEEVVSLGLNYYFSRNLRFMFGWSHILDTSGGTAVTEEAEGLDIFTFRAQLNF